MDYLLSEDINKPFPIISGLQEKIRTSEEAQKYQHTKRLIVDYLKITEKPNNRAIGKIQREKNVV